MATTYDRRRLLRAGAVTGLGAAGAFALACGGGTRTASNTGGQAGAPATVVVGRSGATVAEETPVSGGTLNWFAAANPPTLDPHGTSSVVTMNLVGFAYSRLLRFKSLRDIEASYNLETQPDLALSVESPDAITWTIKLRPDAKFHNVAPVNGHAVEAEDVKASFTRALAPTSANRGALGAIDPNGIQTPDKHTVIFKLHQAYAAFPKLLASSVYGWVLPREAGAGFEPAKQLIGSSGWTLESATPDVAYVFKKNPEWFEKGTPYLDGLKQAIIGDPAQRLAQFTAGNLDVVGVPNEDLEAMQRQNPRAETQAVWDAGGPMPYFQLGEASPWQDVRVRRAVSLAIDRDAFGKALVGGRWEPSFNAPRSQGKWALKLQDLPADTQQWYKFDLPRAKRLIEEAGLSGANVRLMNPTPHPRDPYFKQAAEAFANMLSQLPWRLTLVQIDYNKDWVGGGKGARYGNFPADAMVMTGLEARTDIDEYIFNWWHSKSTSSISRLSDPQLDGMIDKARTVLNETERVKAYIDIQKYMADKVYSASGNPSGLSHTMIQPWARNYTVGDSYGTGTSNYARMWIKK